MIISASRRTDIPAFYSEWFLKRAEAGEVLVRNPMNSKQVSAIPLNPEQVECIVFWTKDPRNMVPRLERLDRMGFDYYFLFTLTPYGPEIEPRVAEKERLQASFASLADRIGARRGLWRYDPILLGEEYSHAFHREKFGEYAERLAGSTERCIVSFLEPYAKVKRTMGTWPQPSVEAQRRLIKELADIAARRGIELYTCAGDFSASVPGVHRGQCIDNLLIQRLTGKTVGARKDPSQRADCGCVKSRDIGAYSTCLHGCLYCYATTSRTAALQRYQGYDPDSPLLCDRLRGDEEILRPAARPPSDALEDGSGGTARQLRFDMG